MHHFAAVVVTTSGTSEPAQIRDLVLRPSLAWSPDLDVPEVCGPAAPEAANPALPLKPRQQRLPSRVRRDPQIVRRVPVAALQVVAGPSGSWRDAVRAFRAVLDPDAENQSPVTLVEVMMRGRLPRVLDVLDTTRRPSTSRRRSPSAVHVERSLSELLISNSGQSAIARPVRARDRALQLANLLPPLIRPDERIRREAHIAAAETRPLYRSDVVPLIAQVVEAHRVALHPATVAAALRDVPSAAGATMAPCGSTGSRSRTGVPRGHDDPFPEEENIVVCVGANNAGKSNLLDAMRLVLGGARRFSPDPADFHQLDLGQEIRIDLHMREPLKRENAYHKTDTIHGFFLRVWRADRGGDRGQLKTEHYCIGADGKTYVPPAAVGRRSVPPDPDAEPVRWLPAPATRILPQLGRIHYLSPSLYRAFDTSGFGVLAQLLDLYRDDFRSDENEYELPGGEVVTRSEAYDRFAVRLSDILRTDRLAVIERSLSANLQTILGPTAAGAEVSIALPSAEELLAEVLGLIVQDDLSSPTLSVDRLGSGYRSLLRLAILRT